MRDVGAPGRDQLREFRLARGHRLALSAQAFVALALGRDREPQFVQLFGQFFVAQTRLFDCDCESRCRVRALREKCPLFRGFVFRAARLVPRRLAIC